MSPASLAETHLPAAGTIPPALAAAVWILWYSMRLGAGEVSQSRRRIRQASLIVMFLSLPLLVSALSFIDPARSPRAYVMAWLGVMVGVAMVLLAAGIDLLNTWRLERRQRRWHLSEDAAAMAGAARRAGAGGAGGRGRQP